MTRYHFDYELPQSAPVHQQVTRNARRLSRGRRAKGIVFYDETVSSAYYFDLRSRRPLEARCKRAMDLLLATILVTLLSPVLLVIIALVKFTSPGPVIFRQRRIGFRCNRFEMYKFRTMVDGAHLMETKLAEERGKAFLKLENDPRITHVGRILRKYSLDELPQLFNVLEGTMSLVGPRPLLVSDLGNFPRRSQMRRFSMPPGITGLWQVSGRSACSDLRRMQLDREYVDRWSLALDVRILFRTFTAVVEARGAV